MAELTFLFDLDDTLYPAESGVWQSIRDRIDLYMHTVLGIPQEEIPALRHRLFTTYGTTLRGLQATMSVDPQEYLRFVHDVPLDRYLTPDPELRRVLMAYSAPKFIFTNGDRPHAHRVLEILGLQGVFEEIIDIVALAPYCKPMPEAFDIALEYVHGARPADCVLVDDNSANLAAAHALGFQTVLIGSPNPAIPFARAIRRPVDLPTLMPFSSDVALVKNGRNLNE